MPVTHELRQGKSIRRAESKALTRRGPERPVLPSTTTEELSTKEEADKRARFVQRKSDPPSGFEEALVGQLS